MRHHKVWKGVLKISTKFTGEHPWWSVISVELQSSFNKIKLRHGCSWTAASEFHSFIHPFIKSNYLFKSKTAIHPFNIVAEHLFNRVFIKFWNKVAISSSLIQNSLTPRYLWVLEKQRYIKILQTFFTIINCCWRILKLSGRWSSV